MQWHHLPIPPAGEGPTQVGHLVLQLVIWQIPLDEAESGPLFDARVQLVDLVDQLLALPLPDGAEHVGAAPAPQNQRVDVLLADPAVVLLVLQVHGLVVGREVPLARAWLLGFEADYSLKDQFLGWVDCFLLEVGDVRHFADDALFLLLRERLVHLQD